MNMNEMNHKLIICVLAMRFVVSFAAMKEHNDGETKVIQQTAGRETKLRCGLRQIHAEYSSTSDVEWHFKPCISITCMNETGLDNIPWSLVFCDGKPCKKSILTLKNLMEKDSGLYNCSVHPYRTSNETTLNIQIFRTFQLEVIDSTITPPIFMNDFPKNITADVDSQIVFQCLIHSKVPPSIKWFKQLNTKNPFGPSPSLFDFDYNRNGTIISNFDNYYVSVASAGEKELYDDTYMSKLILNKVSVSDIGIYVCISINFGGYSARGAYLDVKPVIKVNSESNQLLLLFLIPVVFACIPLIIWGCYLWYRYNSRKKEQQSDVLYESSGRRINNNKRQYIEVHRIENIININ